MKELERETISGSTAIERRIDFIRLRDKLEAGDVLIVTKLDRLGRDAIDVSAKVAKLEELGVWVHCCAFCGVDLASSAGQMTMNVINKVSLVAGLVQTSSGNTLVKTEICGDQKIDGLPDRWLDGSMQLKPPDVSKPDEARIVEAIDTIMRFSFVLP